ncbi:MAG: TatD family hydrolase [Kiritimatiellae bacterium]|nr:TatD family hydrolase [Kiritimatiellia bacterium]
MIRFFDAHNHLQDDRLADRDWLVATAHSAGVARMVVNNATVEDWPLVAELAQRFPDIVQPSFGLHPLHEQPAG